MPQSMKNPDQCFLEEDTREQMKNSNGPSPVLDQYGDKNLWRFSDWSLRPEKNFKTRNEQ